MNHPAAHLAIGRAAEQAACEHLRRLGYRVVLRNFRARRGELDIVALDGPVLALVEVRYRASDDFGGAAASLTYHKRASIVRAAQALLLQRPELARWPARFDVVEVQGTPDSLRCGLIRAAFSA